MQIVLCASKVFSMYNRDPKCFPLKLLYLYNTLLENLLFLSQSWNEEIVLYIQYDRDGCYDTPEVCTH